MQHVDRPHQQPGRAASACSRRPGRSRDRRRRRAPSRPGQREHVRPPQSTRGSTSRPRQSVPSSASALGPLVRHADRLVGRCGARNGPNSATSRTNASRIAPTGRCRCARSAAAHASPVRSFGTRNTTNRSATMLTGSFAASMPRSSAFRSRCRRSGAALQAPGPAPRRTTRPCRAGTTTRPMPVMWLVISQPTARSSCRATAPAATRAAVSRALARSSTSRMSS